MKAKRSSLTRNERIAMAKRQGLRCFTPGCGGEAEIAEHFTPVAMGNDQKPDCLLCIDCARAKTKRDVASIAKVKRIRKREAGETRKKKPIPSRGFDKTKTKGFDGKVRDR